MIFLTYLVCGVVIGLAVVGLAVLFWVFVADSLGWSDYVEEEVYPERIWHGDER